MVTLITSDMAKTGSDHRSGSDLESCEAAPAVGDRGRLHAWPRRGYPAGWIAEIARNLYFKNLQLPPDLSKFVWAALRLRIYP